MRRVSNIITVLALGALILGPGATGAIANSLENIGVYRDGDSVVVTIATSSSCEYNAFLTDSKPERIVIDLVGVENNLQEKQFKELPLHSIHSIRTSQFKSEPDMQARVVLDIERPIEFRSFRSDDKIVVKLPAIADEIQFAAWQYPAGGTFADEPAVDPEEVEATRATPEELASVEEVAQAAPEKVDSELEIAEAVPEKIDSEVETAQAIPVETASIESIAAEEVAEEETTNEEVAVEEEYEDSGAESIMPPKLAVSDPSTPSGMQVETTPKRKIVEYASMGMKDPFTPLVGAGSGRIREGLPSLENLKLVGILEDLEMHRALLEDAEGNGYMLKPNDKIKGGYLVTVTDSKAIFQVTEYGWTRTVALELAIPEIK
ncbi:MAG: hypothetical protein A2W25_02810 [candidate division Zixibacteria bacterium RBG_16_53_22]|nr:MAG: hypothetical protein A2W25_02810 [candidate division Zixibacteria bacterium RBG_16_53_22]